MHMRVLVQHGQETRALLLGEKFLRVLLQAEGVAEEKRPRIRPHEDGSELRVVRRCCVRDLKPWLEKGFEFPR